MKCYFYYCLAKHYLILENKFLLLVEYKFLQSHTYTIYKYIIKYVENSLLSAATVLPFDTQPSLLLQYKIRSPEMDQVFLRHFDAYHSET